MFINFWYPATTSASLEEKPQLARMLGQEFVLARDSNGQAFCLSNVCAHRGGSLANGRMRGDCVACPYHGWQFDSSGACRKIPSLGPDARIPKRARVDSYPVEERYGLVFVFLGDLPEEKRTPILSIDDYDNPGWRANVRVFDASCNFQRSVENGLDPSHAEFVHSFGRKGDNPDYFLPDYDIDEHEHGCGFRMGFKVRDPNGAPAESVAGTTHQGVSQFLTYIKFQDRISKQYMFELPLDENNTRVFLINLRNHQLDPKHDKAVMDANVKVVVEDLAVIEKLHPVVTPTVTNREYLVAADKVTIRYREWIREWTARGWRIDSDAIAARHQRTAFAIPSPARREGGGFVIDTVPLVPPAAALNRETADAAR